MKNTTLAYICSASALHHSASNAGHDKAFLPTPLAAAATHYRRRSISSSGVGDRYVSTLLF